MNRLFYGDNLDVLRQHITEQSVDLVYLDPPFNSDATYNVLFRERDGHRAAAQIKAFKDTWRWDAGSAEACAELIERGGRVAEVMQAFRTFLGSSDMMAYLAMMAPRLVELHRVLKANGSLFLHCDPTASHYLKALLDAIFGPERFLNEIIWKRTSAHGDAVRRFAAVHDTILVYAKTRDSVWNQLFVPYTDEYINEHFVHRDPDGRLFRRVDLRSPNPRPNLTYEYHASNGRLYRPHRNGWAVSRDVMRRLDQEGRLFFPAKLNGRLRRKIYLDESPGVLLSDVWSDLPPIHASSQERLGYPTQKPEALLDRIIAAGTNAGDTVLDPFCGCGTTIASAQKLGRRWVGIDVTHLAIGLIRHRLITTHGAPVAGSFEVSGEPTSLPDAQSLAQADPYQFQAWALGLVGARTTAQVKKGPDRGIDGRMFFHDEGPGGATKLAVFSVKSGRLKATDVREAAFVIQREGAALGALICMDEPTARMRADAADTGTYESPWTQRRYPKLQILTVAELLAGRRFDYPGGPQTNVTIKSSPRVPQQGDQTSLFEGVRTRMAKAGSASRPRRRQRAS